MYASITVSPRKARLTRRSASLVAICERVCSDGSDFILCPVSGCKLTKKARFCQMCDSKNDQKMVKMWSGCKKLWQKITSPGVLDFEKWRERCKFVV